MSYFDQAWKAREPANVAIEQRIVADIERAQKPLTGEWVKMVREAPIATGGWVVLAVISLLWATPLGALARLLPASMT